MSSSIFYPWHILSSFSFVFFNTTHTTHIQAFANTEVAKPEGVARKLVSGCPTDSAVSIYGKDTAKAGQKVKVTCTVSLPEGLDNTDYLIAAFATDDFDYFKSSKLSPASTAFKKVAYAEGVEGFAEAAWWGFDGHYKVRLLHIWL